METTIMSYIAFRIRVQSSGAVGYCLGFGVQGLGTRGAGLSFRV